MYLDLLNLLNLNFMNLDFTGVYSQIGKKVKNFKVNELQWSFLEKMIVRRKTKFQSTFDLIY